MTPKALSREKTLKELREIATVAYNNIHHNLKTCKDYNRPKDCAPWGCECEGTFEWRVATNDVWRKMGIIN